MPRFKQSRVVCRPKLDEECVDDSNSSWLDENEMDNHNTFASQTASSVEFSDMLQHTNGLRSNVASEKEGTNARTIVTDADRSYRQQGDHENLNTTVEGRQNGREDLLRKRPAKLNWDPNISLLELACKLKCAEKNVFGQSRGVSNNVDSIITSRPESPKMNSVKHPVPPVTLPVNVVKHEPFDLSSTRTVETNRHIEKAVTSQREVLRQAAAQPVVVSSSMMDYANARNQYVSAYLPMPVSVFMNAHYPTFNQIIPTPVSMLLRSNEYGNMIPQPVSAMSCTDYRSLIPKPVSLMTSANANFPTQPMYMPRIADYPNTFNGNGNSSAVTRTNGFMPDNQLRCDECSYTTKSSSLLHRHRASVHSKEKPFRCYICPQEFSRSEKVRDHFVSFHPDVAYEAHRTRKFTNIPAMSMPAKDPTTPVKSRMHQRIRELFAGIEGEDVEMSTDPERPFGCLRCSYATRDLWHLRRHVLDIHAAKKQFTCRVCRYATNRPTRLHTHMRSHGELFCEKCDFSSTRLEHFQLHDRLCPAHGDGFRCRTCLVELTDREQLESHVRNDHGSDLIPCTLCKYLSFTDEEFAGHAEAHMKVIRTCQLCGITFNTNADRDIHDVELHLHADVGTFVCNVCYEHIDPPNDFGAAKEHVRSHSPSKVSCTVSGCSFRALLEVTLHTHMENYHGTGSSEGAGLQRPLVKPEPIPSPQVPAVVKPKPVAASPMIGTFACTICNRTPFKYYRSFEKHMLQHNQESQR